MKPDSPTLLVENTPKEPWRIAQNVIILSSAEILSKLFVTLFYIFSARHLGTDGFGIFSAALAIIVIFANFADFGISYLTTREVSRNYNQASRYISEITTFKFVVFVVIFGIQYGTVKILHYSGNVMNAVLLLSFFILFNSLTLSFNSIFQAFEKMIFIAIGRCLGSFVLLLGSLLLYRSNANVSLYCILYVIAFFLTASYGFVALRNKFVIFRFSWKFTLIRSIIKKAIPFGLISIFVPFYYWSGTAFLSLTRSNTEVGLYNASAHLVTGLAFLGGAFLSAVYPLMSREGIASQKSIELIVEKCFKYMLILAIPFWLFIFISKEKIIATLYGTAYLQAIPVLGILAFWGFFIYLNGVWANFFYSVDRQSIIMKQSLAALILNLCLNIAFTPRFGIIGTSAAIVSAEIFSFLFLLYQFIVFGYKISLGKISLSSLKIIIASLFSALLFFLLRKQTLVICSIIFFGSYCASCYLLRVLSNNDILMFKNAVKFLVKRKS